MAPMIAGERPDLRTASVSRALRWATLACTLNACAPFAGYRSCEDVAPAVLALAPARLSQTGLFSNIETEQLAPGVASYAPQFQLWSDGEAKRRWVYLPPSSQIDSADMDAWSFPVGTRLWKEFQAGGLRVETRFLERIGPRDQDWLAVAYAWTAQGDDALLRIDGAPHTLGTRHDVPAANQCLGCHGGSKTRVLGFSAIQLAYDAPAGSIDLASLSANARITRTPDRDLTIPGSAITRSALGYLHANCAHCHNLHRPPSVGARCFDPRRNFDLSLRTNELESVWSTATYRSTVGGVVSPGDSQGSQLFQCADTQTLFRARMPPLATQDRDARGVELIARWIDSLRPSTPTHQR